MVINNETVNYIVDCMKTDNGSKDIQSIQTEHRVKLVQFWDIKEGSKVLEIGCGQGDTTAVLAYFVGDKGFVHGIDIAPPTYGSPSTLGQAAEHLTSSELGKQIKIDFNMDIMSDEVDFPENHFDYIVFSHCSWYMDSPIQLETMLKRIRKWGKKLCFAEWDPRINSIEQYPHLLAVLIQSHYECFSKDSTSNIRTLFTPEDIKTIAENSSWNVVDETSIYSPQLQDAQWEISMTLSDYKERIQTLPSKLKSLIESEIYLLQEAEKQFAVNPLSAYSFIAE